MLDSRDPAGAAAGHRYPAPLSAARALSMLEMLTLPPGGWLLDLACGRGGLLLDALTVHGCRGVGLETDAALRAGAEAEALREGHAGRVEFHAVPPLEYAVERRFDAILAVGPPRAPGPLGELAARCHGWLRLGGLMLHGAPFLRRRPAPAYRALLGEAGEHLQMSGVAARSVVDAGFEMVATVICGESEWDAWESASYRAELRRIAALRADDEAATARERAEAWYQGYWKYGRDTLGYAFHLFRRPRGVLRAV